MERDEARNKIRAAFIGHRNHPQLSHLSDDDFTELARKIEHHLSHKLQGVQYSSRVNEVADTAEISDELPVLVFTNKITPDELAGSNGVMTMIARTNARKVKCEQCDRLEAFKDYALGDLRGGKCRYNCNNCGHSWTGSPRGG